jgi:hypothetical protein
VRNRREKKRNNNEETAAPTRTGGSSREEGRRKRERRTGRRDGADTSTEAKGASQDIADALTTIAGGLGWGDEVRSGGGDGASCGVAVVSGVG